MALVAIRGQVSGPRRLGLLPAEATSFVGRATELAGIAKLLATTRMVTVVGPAGVGKTRTSVRAAAAAAERFDDGTWLADLGGVSDPAQVVGTVAAALGLAPDTDLPAVIRYLRDKRLLLILDTCEHLVDACASLADAILRAVPGVTLLATSRQPLDAPGEHAFPLLPLAVTSDAADLFAQRAAAVVPGFVVTRQNQADVLRLCARLDGVPLAIELAAVRMRAIPLGELASQLESGIRQLTVSRRGTSPRQQTLQAALDWSYRLCTPAERTLWERLSVFADTFDLSGAEDVCADDEVLPRDQIVHALIGLVDKSVVLRDAADPSRYRLLALLREFGADRLEEPERCLDQLTQRAVTVARDFDERFRSGPPAIDVAAGDRTAGSQVSAVRRLHPEYENIRAVLDYALAPDEPTADRPRWRLGADLAVRLSCYWQASGRFEEGRRWLGKVADECPDGARERALALGERGRLATFQGDFSAAIADIRESIRLATAGGRGLQLVAARGYLYLNLALIFAGQHAEAEAVAETARQHLTGCGHQAGIVALEAQLAYLHQLTGNASAALERCDRALALLGDQAGAPDQANGERWVSGYLYLISGLALAQCAGREHASALALSRALTTKHELGDILGAAYALEAFAWLAARREQFERTVWLLGAADQLWDRTGRRLSGVALMEVSRQQVVKTARKALGERRFTAAYAHGNSLDLDTVVRDAVVDGGAAVQRPWASNDLDGAVVPGAVAASGALTKRELEIAELVASGQSNREIATQLFISKRTVDAHVEHIFSKLKISSRVQLTVLLQDQAPRARAADA